MRFFRERFFPEKEKTKKRIERINAEGGAFLPESVDREQLRNEGVLLFENVGRSNGGQSPRRGGSRQGIQFPHHDGYTPMSVITLQSAVPENHLGPIEDPQNSDQSPEREYVEPYTFVCEADALWDVFVQYLRGKKKGFLASLLESDAEGDSADRSTEGKAVQQLRRDIAQYGIEKVGDIDYDPYVGTYEDDEEEGSGTRTWKEWFASKYFGKESLYYANAHDFPGHLSTEQIREFVLFAIDAGIAQLHSWKPGQLLVIDNEKMMHGLVDLTGKGGNPDFRLSRNAYNWSDNDQLVKLP
jgi:hypothetical protein